MACLFYRLWSSQLADHITKFYCAYYANAKPLYSALYRPTNVKCTVLCSIGLSSQQSLIHGHCPAVIKRSCLLGYLLVFTNENWIMSKTIKTYRLNAGWRANCLTRQHCCVGKFWIRHMTVMSRSSSEHESLCPKIQKHSTPSASQCYITNLTLVSIVLFVTLA